MFEVENWSDTWKAGDLVRCIIHSFISCGANSYGKIGVIKRIDDYKSLPTEIIVDFLDGTEDLFEDFQLEILEQ